MSDERTKSRTKVSLTVAEIEALARSAFGSGTRLVSATPANEGWYNAGYALTMTGPGPARAFLKAAPLPDALVLTYEHALMRAEATVMQRLAAADVPHIPALLATDFSRRIVASDCLFMAWVDGELLAAVRRRMPAADRVRVRRQIGHVCGAANRIEAGVFGYPAQPRLQGGTWRQAFERMIAGLLEDAARFEAPLAQPLEALGEAFARAAELLDGPYRPRLTHYDLWDANVLVSEDASGWTLSGVIDWERAFYGDPLADVIGLTMVGDAAEREAVLAGLAEGRGEAHALDEGDRRRLALYRAYLWLIMIVEAGPRGFAGSIRLPTSGASQRLARDLAIAAGESV